MNESGWKSVLGLSYVFKDFDFLQLLNVIEGGTRIDLVLQKNGTLPHFTVDVVVIDC